MPTSMALGESGRSSAALSRERLGHPYVCGVALGLAVKEQFHLSLQLSDAAMQFLFVAHIPSTILSVRCPDGQHIRTEPT